MPRPKTKTELLDLSRENYGALIAMVTPLSAEITTQTGACERWSIKDMLAHLHAWHALYLTWYREGMAGKNPEMPAPGFTWTTTPALNASLHETYKDVVLAEILNLLDGSHQEVMAVIAGHTDAELFTKKRYAWTGTTSLGSYTISAMSSHYDWAIKLIKKFLKTIQ